MPNGFRPQRDSTLGDVIDKILDKGLMINADIAVSVAGTELLGIKIRAALASFETAAKYGLEFPSGTNLNAVGWKEAEKGERVYCPNCGNRVREPQLIEKGCYICGWTSPLRKSERKEIWMKEKTAVVVYEKNPQTDAELVLELESEETENQEEAKDRSKRKVAPQNEVS